MAGDAEHALLEDRVDAVPERDGEAHLAVVVADAAESVLAPAVRARAGVLVREVRPRVAVGRVVLAHGGLGRTSRLAQLLKIERAVCARVQAGPEIRLTHWRSLT